ncbi:MAG: lysylphosphatidylglycerol synthase transmembrane domain-containing protein [Rhodocyclaceae bacterium]
MSRHPVLRLAVRLLVSVVLLGLIAWAVDGAALLRRLASADFYWFALAVGLGILANIVSAWRWLVIARHLGLVASAGTLLPAYGRGVALNTVLPGATLGGDAYRAVILQKLGNPLLKSAASVALDRLSGLWALCVIAWLAWLALAVVPQPGLAPATLYAHLAGIALAVGTPFAARALGARLNLPPQRLPARLLRLLSETARLAQLTFASSAIVQIATIAALWAALNAVTPRRPGALPHRDRRTGIHRHRPAGLGRRLRHARSSHGHLLAAGRPAGRYCRGRCPVARPGRHAARCPVGASLPAESPRINSSPIHASPRPRTGGADRLAPPRGA